MCSQKEKLDLEDQFACIPFHLSNSITVQKFTDTSYFFKRAKMLHRSLQSRTHSWQTCFLALTGRKIAALTYAAVWRTVSLKADVHCPSTYTPQDHMLKGQILSDWSPAEIWKSSSFCSHHYQVWLEISSSSSSLSQGLCQRFPTYR